MYPKILHTLRRVVIAEVEIGLAIQIDAYLRVFSSINPSITRRQYEAVILQALRETGGRAAWDVRPPIRY
jgi:hypothetical protein